MLESTLLENVPGDTDVVREEAFGPVVILSKFTDWETALAEVNDSKFGLQAGLFTRDIHKVLGAWDHLGVGGIVVNDVSSYRVDKIGRAHVCTPVTNAQLVCRNLLEKKNSTNVNKHKPISYLLYYIQQ